MNLPPRQSWPARQKRYDWFRVYNDFVGHPKFRLVAVACGVTISEASMVAVALFRTANRSRPRGSVAEFNTLETGAALDIAPEKVAAVYAKLEELGWIAQDYLNTWDERQPDKEDPTSVDRQRRRRERLKQEREGLIAGRVSSPAPTPALVPAAPSQPADEVASAKLWLFTDAPKLVADALRVRELAAVTTLTGWVNAIGKDYAALALILRGVAGQRATGDSFRNQVGQRIQEHIRGPRLPLGLTAVKGGAA